MTENVDLTEILRNALEETKRLHSGERVPERVHIYEYPDAKAIRTRLGLSQSAFATMLGISKRTLEGWEQWRRKPEGPARRLLEITRRFPKEVYATAFERVESFEVKDGGAMQCVISRPTGEEIEIAPASDHRPVIRSGAVYSQSATDQSVVMHTDLKTSSSTHGEVAFSEEG